MPEVKMCQNITRSLREAFMWYGAGFVTGHGNYLLIFSHEPVLGLGVQKHDDSDAGHVLGARQNIHEARRGEGRRFVLLDLACCGPAVHSSRNVKEGLGGPCCQDLL